MSKNKLSQARAYVLYLLSRRDYSRAQLTKKLLQREFSQNEIDDLLAELIDQNFFKEDAYKKQKLRSMINRGYGASLLKAKLSFEKVAVVREDISEAYEAVGTDSTKQLRALIQKNLRRLLRLKLDEKKLKDRLLAAVMRKGHNIGEALKIIVQEIKTSKD